MNLQDNLSKIQSKANEGIFVGYSHNLVAYWVLNKSARKIKETLILTFNNYHFKGVEQTLSQKPILNETNDESSIVNYFGIDYELNFGVLEKAVDAEFYADDNHIPKASKHYDDSTVTKEDDDSNSTSNSQVNIKHLPNLKGAQVEGENLSLTPQDNIHQSTVEGSMINIHVHSMGSINRTMLMSRGTIVIQFHLSKGAK